MGTSYLMLGRPNLQSFSSYLEDTAGIRNAAAAISSTHAVTISLLVTFVTNPQGRFCMDAIRRDFIPQGSGQCQNHQRGMQLIAPNTYWCLVGNGWEWGNGMIIDGDYVSFRHSLPSTSKNTYGSTYELPLGRPGISFRQPGFDFQVR